MHNGSAAARFCAGSATALGHTRIPGTVEAATLPCKICSPPVCYSPGAIFLPIAIPFLRNTRNSRISSMRIIKPEVPR